MKNIVHKNGVIPKIFGHMFQPKTRDCSLLISLPHASGSLPLSLTHATLALSHTHP